MSRPDDCSLTPGQLARVRKEAERALREAGAFGVLPTPVPQIMAVAKVDEVAEDVLNPGFIAKMRAAAGDALKRAISKVRGLFHASAGLVFLDQTLMAVKKQFDSLRTDPAVRACEVSLKSSLQMPGGYSRERSDISESSVTITYSLPNSGQRVGRCDFVMRGKFWVLEASRDAQYCSSSQSNAQSCVDVLINELRIFNQIRSIIKYPIDPISTKLR